MAIMRTVLNANILQVSFVFLVSDLQRPVWTSDEFHDEVI